MPNNAIPTPPDGFTLDTPSNSLNKTSINPPDGFTLDDNSTQNAANNPKPPEGFTLDQPEQNSGTSPLSIPPGFVADSPEESAQETAYQNWKAQQIANQQKSFGEKASETASGLVSGLGNTISDLATKTVPEVVKDVGYDVGGGMIPGVSDLVNPNHLTPQQEIMHQVDPVGAGVMTIPNLAVNAYYGARNMIKGNSLTDDDYRAQYKALQDQSNTRDKIMEFGGVPKSAREQEEALAPIVDPTNLALVGGGILGAGLKGALESAKASDLAAKGLQFATDQALKPTVTGGLLRGAAATAEWGKGAAEWVNHLPSTVAEKIGLSPETIESLNSEGGKAILGMMAGWMTGHGEMAGLLTGEGLHRLPGILGATADVLRTGAKAAMEGDGIQNFYEKMAQRLPDGFPKSMFKIVASTPIGKILTTTQELASKAGAGAAGGILNPLTGLQLIADDGDPDKIGQTLGGNAAFGIVGGTLHNNPHLKYALQNANDVISYSGRLSQTNPEAFKAFDQMPYHAKVVISQFANTVPGLRVELNVGKGNTQDVQGGVPIINVDLSNPDAALAHLASHEVNHVLMAIPGARAPIMRELLGNPDVGRAGLLGSYDQGVFKPNKKFQSFIDDYKAALPDEAKPNYEGTDRATWEKLAEEYHVENQAKYFSGVNNKGQTGYSRLYQGNGLIGKTMDALTQRLTGKNIYDYLDQKYTQGRLTPRFGADAILPRNTTKDRNIVSGLDALGIKNVGRDRYNSNIDYENGSTPVTHYSIQDFRNDPQAANSIAGSLFDLQFSPDSNGNVRVRQRTQAEAKKAAQQQARIWFKMLSSQDESKLPEGAMKSDGKVGYEGRFLTNEQIDKLVALNGLNKSQEQNIRQLSNEAQTQNGKVNDITYFTATKETDRSKYDTLGTSTRPAIFYGFYVGKKGTVLARMIDLEQLKINYKMQSDKILKSGKTLPIQGHDVEQALQDYLKNHERGYQGDGTPIDSINPPTEPPARVFSKPQKNFLNELFGVSTKPTRHLNDLWQQIEDEGGKHSSSAFKAFRMDRLSKVEDPSDPSLIGRRMPFDYYKVNQNFSPNISQTETPEFKKWFGESKVVNKDGKPLVVYHGTNQPITSFNEEKLGTSTKAYSAKKAFFFTNKPDQAHEYANTASRNTISDSDSHERKSLLINQAMARAEKNNDWDKVDELTRQLEDHELGAMKENTGQNILPVFLNMKNPLEVHVNGQASTGDVGGFIDRARKEGKDGVILRSIEDSPETMSSGDHYVVFKPNQVKSATGNRGTFDKNNPDIRFSPNVLTHELGSKNEPEHPLRDASPNGLQKGHDVSRLRGALRGANEAIKGLEPAGGNPPPAGRDELHARSADTVSKLQNYIGGNAKAGALAQPSINTSPIFRGQDAMEDAKFQQFKKLGQAVDHLGLRYNSDKLKDYDKYQGASFEHDVYFPKKDNRVIKITKNNNLGFSPRIRDGQIVTSNATPHDYLSRINLTNRVFGDDLRLEGFKPVSGPDYIYPGGAGHQIVTSQPFYGPEHGQSKTVEPSETEKRDYLRKLGFLPDMKSIHGNTINSWYRPEDDIVITDAHNGNFIKRADGKIVPIDIPISQLPKGTVEKEFGPRPAALSKDFLAKFGKPQGLDVNKKYSPNALFDKVFDEYGDEAKPIINSIHEQLKNGDGSYFNKVQAQEFLEAQPEPTQLKGQKVADYLKKIAQGVIKDARFYFGNRSNRFDTMMNAAPEKHGMKQVPEGRVGNMRADAKPGFYLPADDDMRQPVRDNLSPEQNQLILERPSISKSKYDHAKAAGYDVKYLDEIGNSRKSTLNDLISSADSYFGKNKWFLKMANSEDGAGSTVQAAEQFKKNASQAFNPKYKGVYDSVESSKPDSDPSKLDIQEKARDGLLNYNIENKDLISYKEALEYYDHEKGAKDADNIKYANLIKEYKNLLPKLQEDAFVPHFDFDNAYFQKAFPVVGQGGRERANGDLIVPGSEFRVHVFMDEHGNPKAIPYGTFARNRSLHVQHMAPNSFIDAQIEAVQKRAEELAEKLNPDKKNCYFSIDMLWTTEGPEHLPEHYDAAEFNPAHGAYGGYMTGNPMILDALICAMKGELPTHAKIALINLKKLANGEKL